MARHRIWFLALAACIGPWCGADVMAETGQVKDGATWGSAAGGPQERYVQAVAELKKLAQERDSRGVKELLKQVKEEFPDRVGPDLDLFVYGELRYWQNNYDKSLEKFEKLLKSYPGSEYAGPALTREFDMAQAYLGGRKKTVLGLIPISGYADGIEMMERISDRAGLDEPNGVGLKAAIAVAERYEAKEDYISAYLKWSEIASYWETGPVAKRAIYRMAEDNLAAYERHIPERRPHYDAAKLATARTYYEKFLALYPAEGREEGVPEKIKRIDEQTAYKQFKIGKFYQRTGRHQAANLYFDMVVRNWPQTEAAGMAKEALTEQLEGKPTGGK
jgi:tetratricopeptide (TPR) repeat protein